MTPPRLARRLLDFLPESGQSWLELGSGDGRIAQACLEMREPAEFVGVELDDQLLRISPRHPRARYVHAAVKYGHARESTDQQDTALQRSAFRRAGIRRVVEEKRGSAAQRPLLEGLIGELQPGDVLCVYKIDRLARSLVDLLRILQRMEAAGATFSLVDRAA